MSFGYLIEKIANAPFEARPFEHLHLRQFFSPEHFRQIVDAPEVSLQSCASDAELIDRLVAAGYEPIPFPGTTNSIGEYLDWHATRSAVNTNQVTCEGIGMVFRLKRPCTEVLRDVNDFFASADFLRTLTDKFGLDPHAVHGDMGLQKYLDGYEISPHPDVRRKALTWMINVNPAADSERLDYHTHYLEFVPERRYVMEYWRYNPGSDRCWVPWGWCRTVKRQTENNSVVIFAPADDTMHAVVARYDHLRTQRTQLYGNLWYNAEGPEFKPFFQDFEIGSTGRMANDRVSRGTPVG
jgi:hypothetical protein